MVAPGPSSSNHISPQASTSSSSAAAAAQMTNGTGAVTFPQYFPVFDYGQHVGAAPEAFGGAPLAMPEQDGAGRYSPESATMQTAWNEFVAQMF